MQKIGLILDGHTISDIVDLAVSADTARFHSVWATELYRTSFQQLTPCALRTTNIKLGTAVSLAFVRSPLITALTALDLDEISGGRLILGLGSGAKGTNERWHSIKFSHPVKRIKECVNIIRQITLNLHTCNDIEFEGDFYKINTRGYKRAFEPLRDEIPIYLAGIGEKMTRASGEVAEGYLGHVVCSLRYLRQVVSKNIEIGREASNRENEEFTRASIMTCAVSDNISDAMHAARSTIAFYATVRNYEPPFKLHGFLGEVQAVRDAFKKGDVKKMIESVTDDMVNTFAIVGTKDQCIKKVNEYREVIDLPILSAPHYYLDFEQVKTYQQAIIDTFGQ